MKNEKVKLIITILITLVIIITIFVPFEQWIFRFKTPEDALKFNYTAKVKEILAKVEIGENYAYISYINKNNQPTGSCLHKDNRGWISPIKQMIIVNKTKTSFDYIINNYVQDTKNLLVITNFSEEKEGLFISISDNIETDFKKVTYMYNGYYYMVWVGLITEYPKDYKIYIDGEVVEL